MHGQYIRNMDRQLISEEDMVLWLSRGDLKGETESKGMATQDQALQTETNSKCRLCQQYNKTVDCIISVCPILAKEKYVKLNDIGA